jgi:toxin ParE1/3/4
LNWEIEFAKDALRDLDLIFDHLADSYIALGEPASDAVERASQRISTIVAAADRIGSAPYRGEAHEDLLPGLRHLTLERAIYWFQIDEKAGRVRILAIFYGGQDHQRKMLLRLLLSR